MIPLNIGGGIRVLILIVSAIMFGATATVCTGFLFTQRPLRALMVAATTDFEHAERAPGVRARLILMWTMCSALPGAGIVVVVMLRANGWIIQADAPIETPVLVLALVAVVRGPARDDTCVLVDFGPGTRRRRRDGGGRARTPRKSDRCV